MGIQEGSNLRKNGKTSIWKKIYTWFSRIDELRVWSSKNKGVWESACETNNERKIPATQRLIFVYHHKMEISRIPGFLIYFYDFLQGTEDQRKIILEIKVIVSTILYYNSFRHT